LTNECRTANSVKQLVFNSFTIFGSDILLSKLSSDIGWRHRLETDVWITEKPASRVKNMITREAGFSGDQRSVSNRSRLLNADRGNMTLLSFDK